MAPKRKPGFTLVELLVVITIIGILIALLLPAVQSARESGRMTQCKNNIYNLARGAMNHRDTWLWYPTGGWGWRWAGEPEQGFSKSQPGGWCYNILPYIEQENLHRLGKGLTGDAKKNDIAERLRTPLAIWHCPTRRRAIQYPYRHDSAYYNASLKTGSQGGDVIGRTDYAMNAGDKARTGMPSGPASISDGMTKKDWSADATDSTGISYLRSEVRIVPDGESNTYLIGERYLSPDRYYSGDWKVADDQGWDVGYDWDTIRWGGEAYDLLPRQDSPGVDTAKNFGSAHSAGWNVSFCDGSVRTLNYSLDPPTHRRLAHRKDTEPINQMYLQ